MNRLNPLAYSRADAAEVVKKRKASGLADIADLKRDAVDPVKLYNSPGRVLNGRAASNGRRMLK